MYSKSVSTKSEILGKLIGKKGSQGVFAAHCNPQEFSAIKTTTVEARIFKRRDERLDR